MHIVSEGVSILDTPTLRSNICSNKIAESAAISGHAQYC